jgi:N-acetylglucosamine-6-phosphate deacetylase
MYALKNMIIYTGEEIIRDKCIVIEGNRIKEIQKDIPEGIEVIDLGGKIIAPSFIDLQLNGCGGVLFNDDISIDALRIMNETNLKSGCTSFLPTLITTSDENIKKAIKLFEENGDMEDIGVLGLHIEGPYISLPKKGIHNPEYVRVLSDEMIDFIVEKGSEISKIMTIAPEVAKEKHLEKLCKAGIRLSVGHSNASYEEVVDKLKYYNNATHLYNAMSPLTGREPGVVGAVLNKGNLYAGIIVDGIHCHYASVDIAKKILKEKLYLVTDAVSPVGTNMEWFMFEGNKVYYKDGKCVGEDGTLGGSALTMVEGVKNLVEHVGLPIEEALKMASTYPSKAVGIDDRYGYIKKNYFADLIVLNEDFTINTIFVKGKKI